MNKVKTLIRETPPEIKTVVKILDNSSCADAEQDIKLIIKFLKLEKIAQEDKALQNKFRELNNIQSKIVRQSTNYNIYNIISGILFTIGLIFGLASRVTTDDKTLVYFYLFTFLIILGSVTKVLNEYNIRIRNKDLFQKREKILKEIFEKSKQ